MVLVRNWTVSSNDDLAHLENLNSSLAHLRSVNSNLAHVGNLNSYLAHVGNLNSNLAQVANLNSSFMLVGNGAVNNLVRVGNLALSSNVNLADVGKFGSEQ
ncbi:unnamed protein product [Candidula unifasciata]|uniref:Uncharacterized protein n=1 Tax=Candidula unifasciata TaxID=100452 RepID=A0A8S3YU68_9EUPU|nr:unnamed protein product [Candidula unifasciata]